MYYTPSHNSGFFNITGFSFCLLMVLMVSVFVHAEALVTSSLETNSGWVATSPLPHSLSYLASVIANNRIYVMGGKDSFVGYYKDVYYADILPDGTLSAWSTTTPLPAGANRADTGLLALTRGNKIYVCGLYKKNGLYAADIQSDGSLGTWSLMSAPPYWNTNINWTLCNDRLYLAIGTGTTTSTASCFVYYADFDTNGAITAWHSTAAIPGAMNNLSLFNIDSGLYAIGRYTLQSYYAIPNSDGTLSSWSSFRNVFLCGDLYLGDNTTLYSLGDGTRKVYSWTYLGVGTFSSPTSFPSLPYKISGHSVVYTDKFYVIGGNWSVPFFGCSSVVWFYNGPPTQGLTIAQGPAAYPGEIYAAGMTTLVFDIFDNWGSPVITQWSIVDGGVVAYSVLTDAWLNYWRAPYNTSDTTQYYNVNIYMNSTDPIAVIKHSVFPVGYDREVSAIAVKPGYQNITLFWENPSEDPLHPFAGIGIVRSANSFVTTYLGIATSFTDTGLSDGTTYTYQLFTYTTDSIKSRGYTLYAQPNYLDDISNFEYQLSERWINLNWSNPTDSNYLATVIVRKHTGYPDSPEDGSIIYWGNQTTCLDTTANLDSTYYYRAFVQLHDNEYSRGSSLLVVQLPPMVKGICDLSYEASFKSVKLTWSNSTDCGKLTWGGTMIFRKLNYSDDPFSKGTVIYQGKDTTFTDTGLSSWTTYYYTAMTYTLQSVYSPGTTISAASKLLGDITKFDYSLKYPYLHISWSNPADVHYQTTVIIRKGNALPQSPTDGDVIYIGNGTFCQDSGLDINTTYYYRAYASASEFEFSAGTSSLSIRTICDLKQLSVVIGAGNYWHLDVNNYYLYVNDSVNGFYIYDVYDAYNPVYISKCTTKNYVYGIYVEGKYAYLAEEYSGVEIADVHDPYHPVITSRIPTSYCSWDVTVQGDYAYIADASGGLKVVNVTDRENPRTICVDASQYMDQVILNGNYLYAGYHTGISVYDIHDPYEIKLINYTYFYPGYPSVSGRYYISNGYLFHPYCTTWSPFWRALYEYWEDWTYMRIEKITNYSNYSTTGDIIMSIVDGRFSGPVYFNDVGANEIYAFGNTVNTIFAMEIASSRTLIRKDMGHGNYRLAVKGNRIYGAGNNEWGIMQFTSFQYGCNYLEIGEGPQSDANPANSGDTVTCFVYPSDNWGYEGFSYQWTAEGGVLSKTTTDSPTWIVPVNSACTVQYYQISVTVDNLRGISRTTTFYQGVRASLESVHALKANPLDNGVKLTWFNPVSKNYSGTLIRRKEGGYPAGPTDGVQVYWSNGEAYNDMGLMNGKTYYYAAFSHDSLLNYTPAIYTRIYLPWNNNNGTFAFSSSTIHWAFENINGVGNQPAYSWLSSYANHPGILCLSFSSQTEAVKITSNSRFAVSTTNPWYRLRMNYYAEGTTSGMEIKSSVLLYSDHSSYAVREVAGNWTGNGLVHTGTWYTYDMYAYCRSSSAQVQVVIKNNGSKGKLYIDTLSLDTITPPALTNGTTIQVVVGDFDTGDDTTSWAFETPPLEPWTFLPTCSWLSSFSNQTGVLTLSFDQATQGVKLTSIPTYILPKGKNAILTFKVYSDISSPSELQVIGYLYAERTVAIFQVDLGAKGELGVLPGNQWNTVYIPLTSVSGNTVFRLQMLFKNGLQYPEMIYIDDVQLKYDSSVSTLQWVELYDDKKQDIYLQIALR